MEGSIKIFISYAHEDELLFREVEKRLSLLQRQGMINVWHDHTIQAGTEWEPEVATYLNNARIILLLVSPDFLNSDYCYSVEMKSALERHERGDVLVIPIILRPVHWQSTPFGKLQALPEFGQPIISRKWDSLDDAFFAVENGIRNAIEKLMPESTTPSDKQLRELTRESKGDFEDTFPVKRNFPAQNVIRICPACIEEFYPGDCEIVSQVTGQVLKAAPTEWLAKQYARRNPLSLSTPAYIRELACRICPHCGYCLPYNIEAVENMIIAVVGETGSGKSHYIASLIHQMQGRWINANAQYIQVKCLTKRVVEDNYLIPVFYEHEQLEATGIGRSSAHEPIIYELTFRNLVGHSTKRINLILYDGAGLDYRDPARMVYYSRHVLHARGIIFLVDPLQIPFMCDRLPDHLKIPYGVEILEKAHLVFGKILEVFEGFNDTDAEHIFRTFPIATVISKSDLLRYTAPIVPPYRIFSNPDYPYRVNLQELDAVDKEVRLILEESGEHGLLHTTQSFLKAKFFATSATGCPPDASGKYPFIDPCRCLDPLLWILHSVGIDKW